MNKKIVIIAGGAAAIVIGILLWWLFSGSATDAVNIEKFHLLKDEIVPMRLKVVVRSDGSAQIAVKFFDVDGKAVGRCELPYAGGSITQKILDVNIKGHHVYLPSEMAQSSASPDTLRQQLQQYYVKDGFPMIYFSQVADAGLLDEIRRLYSRLLDGDIEPYGTVRQIEVTLGEPMERVNYSLSVKADGGVRIGN